jgi:hypothetical protein
VPKSGLKTVSIVQTAVQCNKKKTKTAALCTLNIFMTTTLNHPNHLKPIVLSSSGHKIGIVKERKYSIICDEIFSLKIRNHYRLKQGDGRQKIKSTFSE